MTNITKLEFEALDISGKNYLSWILDAEVHLISKNLGDTIKEANNESLQDLAKSLIFLRHHLDDGLKAEHLTVKNPQELWKDLKERFDHQRTIVLPRARYEWIHLRLQDFKSNNELLMKNHQMRPTGSSPFPEANETAFPEVNVNSTQIPHYGRGRGRGRGRGNGQRKNYQQRDGKRQKTNHQPWKPNNEESVGKPKEYEDKCFKCGTEGHWSHTCRTAKHLVDLYQNSIKGKGKIETNFADDDGPVDITHLDVSDFFAQPDENIDHLIGGGVLENID
ncbi:uncharacterized protein [Primulina huaijiensis]|uniref:uncharacterized protein n=1 Tax=Primulina huaijiensis TaxID=1492673 RepID=UPI003CC6E9F8